MGTVVLIAVVVICGIVLLVQARELRGDEWHVDDREYTERR